ncbi:CoA-transferase [Castellaniella sp. GW247-6E4]|uniref:acyl CoA:acetate/3-ketoacid CoA transferase n=1 Tax=Castellaniella sp. GW247-6E4 TaxID=3140380 RepID=UPI0033145B84
MVKPGRVKVMSADEAVQLIKSGSTVGFSGAGGGIVEATELINALANRYKDSAEPKNLTILATTGLGDRAERGISPLAQAGLCKRAVMGHWGQSPRFAEMAERNEIEAYNYPQGVMCQMYRAVAAGQPGVLTHTGLGTFMDPRQRGAKVNDCTHEELVRLMEIDGKEFLFYKAIAPDVCIIRGTTADTEGYISLEDEITPLDVYAMAAAAHNSGGIVIAQVARLVKKGSLHPKQVKIPGYLVDVLVVVPEQPQVYCTPVNRFVSGDFIADTDTQEPLPLTERKLIARRALMEAEPGDIGNLGVGIADGIGNVAAEEGVIEHITLTTEHGAIGGITTQGHAFGACVNMKAVIDMPSQFEFYDGGGLDICFVSFAEIDQSGNVNVHKFNGKIMGSGGFINITQNSRKVVFCGTLKSGGIKTNVGGGRIEILHEGRFRKLVPAVDEITFSGRDAIKRGQRVMFITERAVFSMTQQGLELSEVAPGLDVERDVIAHMGFRPLIAKDLKEMDERLFGESRMGLEHEWTGRS